jgi:hypothetical protein
VALALVGGALVALALLGGCASTRGHVDLKVPSVQNPATGRAVRIGPVTDRRIFQVDSPDPSAPSLKRNEIGDASVTSRAYARKRESGGELSGDVLLPPGRTIVQLVEEVMTRAFREAGYRVLGPSDDGYAAATPIGVEINRFWAFVPTLKTGVMVMQFQADLRLTGGLPSLGPGMSVQGAASQESAAPRTRVWRALMAAGLDNLINNTRAALQTR